MTSHDHTDKLRFSSPESSGHILGASIVVVEEEIMADFPVLTFSSQRTIVLCPSGSSDAEGSQPAATTLEGHDSLNGPIIATLCILCSLKHPLKHLLPRM